MCLHLCLHQHQVKIAHKSRYVAIHVGQIESAQTCKSQNSLELDSFTGYTPIGDKKAPRSFLFCISFSVGYIYDQGFLLMT